ncbi:WAT1-related protein, partial [Cucurbita argyrosperma subsp. argyrosperma]
MGLNKPYVAAFFIQITFAGMSLMSKAAFAAGEATIDFQATVRDFCHFIDRVITLALDAYGMAINYTSATLGAAAFNCVPVTTFFFAVLLRMEMVNLKTAGGIAKVVGIMVCMAGAAILAFYKGPYLKPLFTHQLFHHAQSQAHHPPNSQSTWMIGCFFLLVTSISWGIWFVLQARFLKRYPHLMEFMCVQTVMSMVQSFVVAIAMERDPLEWKLGWNVRLFAVLYCGILVIGIANNGQCWVIREKGPVFQAMTTPLNLIATIIGSQLILSEGIYLGSIIGACFLVMSLYSVLWGKNKELGATSSSQPAPLEKEIEELTSRAEILLAGMSLLSKAAFASGMNSFVFVFYRQAAGAVFYLPLIMFLKRMEKVRLRTVAGMAKAFGILVCIGGVITLAFYKGPYLKPLINHHLFQFHKSQTHKPHISSTKTWIIGCFLLFLSSISWEKGPVFQAMTTPLNVIATIIGSELLLGEGINLGSLIGAMLLVVSLYSVLWGKSKELNVIDIDSNQPREVPEMMSPPQP